ncbi:TPA: hypothetical protein DEF17_00530 [bacterium]|nr:MAG: hypothetical protein AUJ18_01750 [Candidatus Hydrogenedentes bacterium CG1_02_42_14]HBW46404.1 hypothetical protein [bacterium]
MKDLSSKRKVNLMSGGISIDGYWSVDILPSSDVVIDLEKELLPFSDNSMEIVVCISAINYFTRLRAEEIIKDVHRILVSGGIARFGTQDMRIIAKYYLGNDRNFFFQKLENGKERFHGKTMCDKINSWFYGYETYGGKSGKYMYDFETLKDIFKTAGFKIIEERKFRDSRIKEINEIDNRPEQMFFLEAIK